MGEWKKYIDEPEKKLYNKKEPGYNMVSQYLEAVLNAPYMNILLLLMEVDLMKQWVPLTTEAKILNQY